jgi:hypothetical protein
MLRSRFLPSGLDLHASAEDEDVERMFLCRLAWDLQLIRNRRVVRDYPSNHRCYTSWSLSLGI